MDFAWPEGIQANLLGACCSWKARQATGILHAVCWGCNKKFTETTRLGGLEIRRARGKAREKKPDSVAFWVQVSSGFWLLLHRLFCTANPVKCNSKNSRRTKLRDSTFQMYVLNHWAVRVHLLTALWVQVSAVPFHTVARLARFHC